jgi:putative spermidine/putrescine transport system permease protein
MMRVQRQSLDLIGLSLAVVLVMTGMYVLAPIFFIVVSAFNPADYNKFPIDGVSLRWFKRVLFETPEFVDGFRVSVIVALGAAALALLMGTLASRALVRYRFRLQGFMQSFLFSPQLVPRIVFGCAVFLLYIRIQLYGTLAGLVLAHSLLGLPFAVSVISATLIGITPGTEEAAMDLGATPLKAFLLVTLPQMRSGLIVAGLFAFITSFDQVNVSMFLTRPRNNTLPIEMLIYIQHHQDPSLSAVSTLLIAFSVVLVFLTVPFVRVQEYRRLVERR